MSARKAQPKPGVMDVRAQDDEGGSVQECERLRLQLAEVTHQLAESERARRDAEARLSSADGPLAACLDGMVDGVVIDRAIRDENGRIVDFWVEYANEAASRLSGLTHEELVGHRILELFPGRRENGQFDAYVHVVETGEPLVRNSVHDHEAADRSDPDGFGRDYEVSVTRLGDGYVATLQDIVARRRAEDELFRAQQLLRLVLDTVPQRVFWKDTHAVFVGCNAAFAGDAGLSDPAEIVGRTDYDLPWRDLADGYLADDLAVMESGRPTLGHEEMQVRSGGRETWVSISKVPLLDADGSVVGMLGTTEDITDRRRAEQALRESEQFLADILENIPSMVYVKDAKTLTFVRVNRATEQTLGYSSDQLVSPDSRKLGLPAESDYYAAMDQRVVDTGQLMEFPLEVLTPPDGRPRYLRTKKVPLFDEQGKPKFVLGISEDITDLKLAEDARLETEQRYRQIVETITDYVVNVKIEDGQATNINHGAGCVAVTGYSAEELSDDPGLWLSLVVAEDRDAAADQVQRILAGKPSGPLEYRILRKDGVIRWVRNTPVLRLSADGSPIAYDGVIQDITERRALQEQLLQSQKMEGIGRLAGGVAHDFNNLLTAILGYVEMCKSDLPPDLAADHPARLDLLEVAMAGERAANLTRQLLAFASRQIVAAVRLDLSTLAADSLKMLQRLLGDNIEIETVLDPGVGTVEADAGQMQQLLVNLAINARDAMPDGGRLLIETADETIGGESAGAHPGAVPGQYVVLAVTDTGVGMNEEVLSHLFEPFFTTKGLGKGTGLGLATCHGIVRQMGGHIRVYSEPGRGTTFRIYLPRKAGLADPQPVSAPPRPSPTGVETVLVVEDEPTVRRLAVLGLRAHGYAVLEAADGAEAIEAATRVGTTIDVIVSDVMMPGMSGPELLNRLSTIAPQARAMLMSGHAESTVLSPQTALRYAFLPKPFTPERLARKVREVLDASKPG
jgi:two-component system, cell cycle sensor histidine kinase and response regulator CckA